MPPPPPAVAVAVVEAASRGGIHAVNRLVKLAMADGTCKHSPAVSGEHPADGDGEVRGDVEGPGTLPAPAP
jgi:hypothetical protein